MRQFEDIGVGRIHRRSPQGKWRPKVLGWLKSPSERRQKATDTLRELNRASPLGVPDTLDWFESRPTVQQLAGLSSSSFVRCSQCKVFSMLLPNL